MKTKLIFLILLAGCSSQIFSERNDFGAKKTLDQMYREGIERRDLGQADACLQIFSDIIELRKQVKDSLYVYSLYQSGLCLEMKNQFDKAIAAYQDALRPRGVVPSVFYQLEIPARLAVNYSKIGDSQTSDQYYLQAKKALERLLKNKNEIAQNKRYYAELLYQVGIITTDFKRGSDFDGFMKSIRFSQEYLTLAMELNEEPYSRYAAQQLLLHFKKTYDYISSLEPEKAEDEILAKRQNQQEKMQLSEKLLHHLDQFYAFLKTKRQVTNSEYQPLIQQLKDLQTRLEKILSERPAGEGLTPEAQELQKPRSDRKMIPVPGEKESGE